MYCRWGCCRLCLFSPLGSACWCGFRLRPGFGYAVVSRLVMLWATSTYLRIACTVVQKIGNLFLALFPKQPCFLIEMRTECSIGDPPPLLPPSPCFGRDLVVPFVAVRQCASDQPQKMRWVCKTRRGSINKLSFTTRAGLLLSSPATSSGLGSPFSHGKRMVAFGWYHLPW